MRRILYVSIALSVLFLAWIYLRMHNLRTDRATSSIVLRKDDREKVILNQHTHTITEVTRNAQGKTEIKREFFPNGAAIEESKSGTITVTGRKWGTEISPALGILYGSDFSLRGVGTLGLLYYTRLEFGVGLSMGTRIDTARPVVDVTYNCYDSIIVGAYVDNHRDAGVITGLKF